MKEKEYKVCKNCVMDTRDWSVSFNEEGICNHCENFYNNILPSWKVDEQSEKQLMEIANKIKISRKGEKYDCIMGFSGGVDSSYLAYVVKEKMKLNPLLYMLDGGWNEQQTWDNVKKITKKLNLDIVVETVDWEEMKDLQLAYLKSGLPYQDTPQDHAIFAGLYNYAIKNKFKYVITGANVATECILPGGGWNGGNDLKLLMDVHKKFGTKKLKTYPRASIFKYRIYYRYFKGMKRIAPLNYLPFNTKAVENFLKDEFDWESYENKHYENVLTRWDEGFYMPKKFNYDKRMTYFSSLILSNNMTREEALKKLEEVPYSEEQSKKDMLYIANKLEISKRELSEIVSSEPKSRYDYKNSTKWILLAKRLAVFMGLEKRFVKVDKNKFKNKHKNNKG